MTTTLSLTRKLLAIGAVCVIANDLEWLGFPCKFESWWLDGTVSAISGAAWAAGLFLPLAPWAHRQSRFVSGLMAVASAALAVVIALAVVNAYNAPIAEVIDPVIGFVLATWSLAGGITLLATALWPLKPFKIKKLSYAGGFTNEPPVQPTLIVQYEGEPVRSFAAHG